MLKRAEILISIYRVSFAISLSKSRNNTTLITTMIQSRQQVTFGDPSDPSVNWPMRHFPWPTSYDYCPSSEHQLHQC